MVSNATIARLVDESFKPFDRAKTQHSKSRHKSSILKEWGSKQLVEHSVSTEREVSCWLVEAAEKFLERNPKTKACSFIELDEFCGNRALKLAENYSNNSKD